MAVAKDERPRRSSLDGRASLTALEVRVGIGCRRGSERKKEQNHDRSDPQQRDRIKMCAEDVYVRRRGTAIEPREFQPLLRHRLRPSTVLASFDTLHPLCSQGISVAAATRKVPRVLYMRFVALVRVKTPQTHGCRVNSCLEVREPPRPSLLPSTKLPTDDDGSLN